MAAAVAWPIFGRVAPPVVALHVSTWNSTAHYGTNNWQQPSLILRATNASSTKHSFTTWGTFVSCVTHDTVEAARVYHGEMHPEEHRTRLADSYCCYGKAMDAVVGTLGQQAVQDHHVLSKFPGSPNIGQHMLCSSDVPNLIKPMKANPSKERNSDHGAKHISNTITCAAYQPKPLGDHIRILGAYEKINTYIHQHGAKAPEVQN